MFPRPLIVSQSYAGIRQPSLEQMQFLPLVEWSCLSCPAKLISWLVHSCDASLLPVPGSRLTLPSSVIRSFDQNWITDNSEFFY